jgi:hypothetical protein
MGIFLSGYASVDASDRSEDRHRDVCVHLWDGGGLAEHRGGIKQIRSKRAGLDRAERKVNIMTHQQDAS